MKYAGQVRSNGSLDYCTPIVDTREEAAALCFAKRPNAQSCITMEAHWNEGLRKIVPTHIGVRQHKRPDDWRPAFFTHKMKRRVNGEWQYRDMTQDEMDAREDVSIW